MGHVPYRIHIDEMQPLTQYSRPESNSQILQKFKKDFTLANNFHPLQGNNNSLQNNDTGRTREVDGHLNSSRQMNYDTRYSNQRRKRLFSLQPEFETKQKQFQ